MHFRTCAAASLSVFLTLSVHAQHTVGLLSATYPLQENGYVLYSPVYTTSYLVDRCGNEVHAWNSAYNVANIAYLQPNGHLLRAGNLTNNYFLASGGGAGILEEYDWDGNLVWSYILSDSSQVTHHDFCPMPNGHILVLVWEAKHTAETILAGRDTSLFIPTRLFNEKVMELQPIGSDSAAVVWEWSLWDHLVQEVDSSRNNFGVVYDHPELMDINYVPNLTASSWAHFNSIDYNPDLDMVLLSSRSFSEVWVIDHSTTMPESASHSGGNYNRGGDLLFRWGNPEVYGHGTAADRKLYGQHNARWIKPGLAGAGSISVYNNGVGRPEGNYSTVENLRPVLDTNVAFQTLGNGSFAPDSSYWIYAAATPTDMFSLNISGAQRLHNGHTFITIGQSGVMVEIDTAEQIIWKYKNPVLGSGPVAQGSNIPIAPVFHAVYYTPDYPGFTGHALVPGAPVELNPVASPCEMVGAENIVDGGPLLMYPNPAAESVSLELPAGSGLYTLRLTDLTGRVIYVNDQLTGPYALISLAALRPGIYMAWVSGGGKIYRSRLVHY